MLVINRAPINAHTNNCHYEVLVETQAYAHTLHKKQLIILLSEGGCNVCTVCVYACTSTMLYIFVNMCI